MNKPAKGNSRNQFWDMLLLLVMLGVFFGSGKYINGTIALRQEADGLRVEQFVDYPSKAKQTDTIKPAESISPFPVRTFLTSLIHVLNFGESSSAAEAPLSGFGQRIVSFLAKSRTCHKASDEPHLFSC